MNDSDIKQEIDKLTQRLVTETRNQYLLKVTEAIGWIEFVMENPDEIRSLKNALDLLNTLKEMK